MTFFTLLLIPSICILPYKCIFSLCNIRFTSFPVMLLLRGCFEFLTKYMNHLTKDRDSYGLAATLFPCLSPNGYTFIQQIFFEYILYARHCTRPGNTVLENVHGPCLHGALFNYSIMVAGFCSCGPFCVTAELKSQVESLIKKEILSFVWYNTRSKLGI